MAVGESEIQEAAEGLVVRHGRNAVSVAKELVDVLEKQRNQPELDTALRVLAAVERLVDTEDSTGTQNRKVLSVELATGAFSSAYRPDAPGSIA